jgi:hypothetical protein
MVSRGNVGGQSASWATIGSRASQCAGINDVAPPAWPQPAAQRWFGGLHLPSYSAVSPVLMAHVGGPATGAIATALAVLAMARLFTTRG